MYNYGMYNLLRLKYSDEILKILVVVVTSIFRLFHDKNIGIDFRLVNCLLTGRRNLEIRLFMTFIQLLLCSFTEVLTKFKEPAS